jgi:hypothetical protein
VARGVVRGHAGAGRISDAVSASRPPTPRWVKLLGLAALVIGLLFVLVMLLAGGDHGPSRHLPPLDTAPPALTTGLGATGLGWTG